MVDSERLSARFEELGLKKKIVAEQIGLTYQGYWNKEQNLQPFTLPEAEQLSKILRFNRKEFFEIFFKKNK